METEPTIKEPDPSRLNCDVGHHPIVGLITPDGWQYQEKCSVCGIVLNADVKPSTFEAFIRRYIHGELGKKKKLGHYLIDERGNLVYRGSGRHTGFGDDKLVLKLKDGRLLGNASKLDRCGSYRKAIEAPAQQVMFQLHIGMVPFSVFDQAKLDVQKARVVDQGPEEDLLMPKLEWSESHQVLEPVDIRPEIRHTEEEVAAGKCDDYYETTTNITDKDGEYLRRKDKSLRERKVKRCHGSGKSHHPLDKSRLALRHFVGAMVLRVGREYFLFDIDRREVEHYNFNPFLVHLPSKVRTIKEAYELLKPSQVRTALRKGLKVLRQGEWFFIPVAKPRIPKMTPAQKKAYENDPRLSNYDLDKEAVGMDERTGIINVKETRKSYHYDKIQPRYRSAFMKRVLEYNKAKQMYNEAQSLKWASYDRLSSGELRAGNNRPNHVEKMLTLGKDKYVSGTASHEGREHEPLELKGWYKPVPNTAIESWTITGQVD